MAWTSRPAAAVAEALLRAARGPVPVVAVDGRSASGKSTTAALLAGAVDAGAVVHTDDVAWHHAFFDWADLLRDGVLAPAREGRLPVRYRPPAWDARGREGAVEVPAGCRLLVVEGVGVGRRALAPWFDALVWVESDAVEARRRGVLRDGGDGAAEAFWDEWDAEEVPFLERERPWARADVVVSGTPGRLPGGGPGHDPAMELVVRV